MASLNRCVFLNKTPISSSCSPLSLKRHSESLKLSSVRSERNDRVLMESSLKDSVLELDPVSAVNDGVLGFYGEVMPMEDQGVTPWTVSVASGYTLLRNPHHNKGLAFTDKERDTHYLRGLLPPTVISQDLQVKKLLYRIRQYQVPLQKYMAMMDLQESNEKLFYKLLIEHVEELLPVVYTPTVGEACQKYGSIFRRPQGLYISLREKGKILEVLRNWPEMGIQVIVVTDGERILGLGDLGCQGMGIPVGKLSLYSALGGVRPSACLPVTIDVGTNNDKLLNDEFYIGLRQKRATGQEYEELVHEFMAAVKQNYGEKILIQFEDFANHNAFDLLEKYGKTHLVFNDDIQGTASVVLAGLIAALKLVGGTLADHKFLFLGAGEAGTGIAELIALEMFKKMNTPLEDARKKIWLVDSKGLIVSSRKESLQHFKKPWAHEHEPIQDLVDAVKDIKPTVLIGTSGVGRTFTKDVVEAMAAINKKPIILALSNPTSQSECTAEEAYTWTEGRAIFASGSPFDPVEYNGNVFVPGQANNAYIFPGFGLGLIMSGTIRVRDDMLLAASEALAAQVTQENLDKGLIFPPFTNIRKISANIAAKVAAKAYELGLAGRLPQPKDLVKHAESCMYTPSYPNYR
ncbi:NADP-dependent malic enzyme-like isoform X2 [Cucurbita pepo subsp. pepo]|uniref:NADP-dependent malic enzyme-like isoform X2 n=1 Tax=Cucurbita pepo subsp. pepo TaxID=3664 RepID=UPI000C9D34C7|nr:NADP-dependent malic enzyme-like isoform X2 [Cucurbita pepo subsp. pepo]XP_023547803.1 NADP-dependent malic enzyme-like isoform X2 [Cucurbita pepo subsp. pepo]